MFAQHLLGGNGRIKSMVSIKKERADRLRQLKHANLEADMLGDFIRLVDYIEVEHLVLPRQIGGTLSTAATTLLDDHFFRLRFRRCGRWLWLRIGEAVKERRTLNAFRTPAKGHSRQVVNVGLLLIDDGTQLRHGGQ